MDEQWMDFITARAEGRQLLIIDTLRQIHTEDENDSTGMARVLNRLQTLAARTGCAVIFLHHTSKQGERDGSRSAGGISWLIGIDDKRSLAGICAQHD
ncbi:AAA family ATPase [Aeromonas veronii]